jgi:hypothetical protein
MEQTSAKTFTNRLFYAILLWQCNKNLKKVRTLFLYIKRKTGLSVINVFCFETRKGKGGRRPMKKKELPKNIAVRKRIRTIFFFAAPYCPFAFLRLSPPRWPGLQGLK